MLLVAVLSILYSTGIRIGELERLRVQDWVREEGLLKIDGSKSNRERIIPVPGITYRSIEGYLSHRQNKLLITGKSHDRLLANMYGNPLSGQQVRGRIARLCKRVEVSRITPHQFRHSCASDLLEAGVGILEVRSVLGHAYIGTTYRYTAIAGPARKEAISRHPINGMLQRQSKQGEEQ